MFANSDKINDFSKFIFLLWEMNSVLKMDFISQAVIELVYEVFSVLLMLQQSLALSLCETDQSEVDIQS